MIIRFLKDYDRGFTKPWKKGTIIDAARDLGAQLIADGIAEMVHDATGGRAVIPTKPPKGATKKPKKKDDSIDTFSGFESKDNPLGDF